MPTKKGTRKKSAVKRKKSSSKHKLKVDRDDGLSASGSASSLTREDVHQHFLNKVNKWIYKFRSRAIDIFRQFDTNGDGVLSREEFRTGLQQLKAPLTEEEMTLLIDTMDKDGDGAIDYAEFQKGISYRKGSMLEEEEDDIFPPLVLSQSLEHCNGCGLGLWDPKAARVSRYVEVEMKLAPFASRSHPLHLTVTVSSFTTIYGVARVVCEHFGGVMRNMVIFSELSCSSDVYLKPSLTLEDCGFDGGPLKKPEAVTLYYNYSTEFTDCPLLMNDGYF